MFIFQKDLRQSYLNYFNEALALGSEILSFADYQKQFENNSGMEVKAPIPRYREREREDDRDYSDREDSRYSK